MKITTASSLAKISSQGVLQDIEELQPFRIHMPRNSYGSFQIVLCNEDDFKISNVDIVTTSNIRSGYNFAEDMIFIDGAYPDILSAEKSCQVKKNKLKSIWITFFAEEQAEKGIHSAVVKVMTTCGTLEVKCDITVYSVSVPEPKDSVFSMEYWMHTISSWFRNPEPLPMDYIKHHYGCEKYSDDWWKINKAIAESMKESRINVLFVRTMDLLIDGGTTVDPDGTVHFDWSLFDKWIDLYLMDGSIKKLAGFHIIMQAEGDFVFVIKPDENEGMKLGLARIGEKEAEDWLNQFLPALYEHLVAKSYKDMWMQHVQDEPAKSDSWLYGHLFVKKHMPDIICFDAIDNQSPMYELHDGMDLWIPRVDIYEKNREFYDYRLSKGESRWVYTCCLPNEMNYVNKFIDWPLIHNRVLFWGCFGNHFSGFLHWAYNYWDPEDKCFGMVPDVMVKGDGYIVYPDKENMGVKNSVRMISTRDSAQDYELLDMLAQKNPKLSYELTKSVINRFNDFNWDVAFFEETRIKLLEALESTV